MSFHCLFLRIIVILVSLLPSIHYSQSIPVCFTLCMVLGNSSGAWPELDFYLQDWRRLEALGIDCSCHAEGSAVAIVVFTIWHCGVAWAIHNDSDGDCVQASIIGEESSSLSL